MAQGREVQSPRLEGRPRWGLGRGRGRRAGDTHGRACVATLCPAGTHRAPTVGQALSSSWGEGHPRGRCCFDLHSVDVEAEAQRGAVTNSPALEPGSTTTACPRRPSSPLLQKPAAFPSWGSRRAPAPSSCQD